MPKILVGRFGFVWDTVVRQTRAKCERTFAAPFALYKITPTQKKKELESISCIQLLGPERELSSECTVQKVSVRGSNTLSILYTVKNTRTHISLLKGI